SFDGNSTPASELISAVEALTGQQGLAELRMVPCGPHLSCRALIRDYQAWCPEYQNYVAIHKEVRTKLVRGMVRSATMAIHASGQYPTLGRVGYGLPSFVDMREHVAREEWRKTLQELGLD